jgi:hypothetical protein
VAREREITRGRQYCAPTTGQFDFANVPTDNLERLEVLRELVPTTTTMAVLVNPINDPAVVEK